MSLPASAKTWKEVRFGVTPSYPPFSFIDQNNRFQGFEIDLARALCARMKVSCVFVKQDWEDIIPALLAHRLDAIFASMSITNERQKQIAFSNRYYQTPTSFIARKALNLRDTSPAGLKGRVLGAQESTTQATYLREVYAPAGAVVRFYTTQAEAQFDLARGRLDAILIDKLSVFDWLKTDQGQCCGYAGPELNDPRFVGEGIGAGLRKEDVELQQMFNSAIDAIVADGTYKKINDKYFPFSVY